MNISVIGAGYVGLVTAAVFSELGNKVFCVDIDKEKIKNLNLGIVPFFEPQLEEYIQKNSREKRLFFTNKYLESVPKSQTVIICVGTPPKENGQADLSFLFSALEESAKHLKGYTLIVIKSTVPIGYEDDLEKTVKKHAKTKFEFAACPEFLREGNAIEDSLHPDRIVIGTKSKKAHKMLLELHAPISGERIVTDMRSAQLIKYASNSLLATKVSFANAIAILCEKMEADASKVLYGVGADRRLGHHFLKAGVGYGGSCLPKDVLAFITQADAFDYDFELLKAVDSINNSQIERLVSKIQKALGSSSKQNKLKGFKIALLGLAFKPDTDDMRDAPSIKIIGHLLSLGAQITAYDPESMENSKKIFPQIEYASDVYQAAEGKDVLVIVTDWPQFSQIDLEKINKLMRKPIIVDGRNILSPPKAKHLGFKYIGIGQ